MKKFSASSFFFCSLLLIFCASMAVSVEVVAEKSLSENITEALINSIRDGLQETTTSQKPSEESVDDASPTESVVTSASQLPDSTEAAQVSIQPFPSASEKSMAVKSSNKEAKKDANLTRWLIWAGIGCGGFVFGILIGCLLSYFCCVRGKKSKKQGEPEDAKKAMHEELKRKIHGRRGPSVASSVRVPVSPVFPSQRSASYNSVKDGGSARNVSEVGSNHERSRSRSRSASCSNR
uniref:Transmembrane protein n=1 Tax=Ditylenchus dipsaci TaxID=166011 RepID=A0A915DC13_9BILA